MPETTTPRKRANGKRSGAWITRKRRLAVYLRDEFRCQYCGVGLHHVRPRDITLDHLTPRELGGTHESANLVTACHPCNSRKRDRPLEEFVGETRAAYLRALASLPLPLELAASLLAKGTSDPGR